MQSNAPPQSRQPSRQARQGKSPARTMSYADELREQMEAKKQRQRAEKQQSRGAANTGLIIGGHTNEPASRRSPSPQRQPPSRRGRSTNRNGGGGGHAPPQAAVQSSGPQSYGMSQQQVGMPPQQPYGYNMGGFPQPAGGGFQVMGMNTSLNPYGNMFPPQQYGAMGPAGVPGLGYGGGAAPPWPSAGVGGLGIPMGAMGAFGAPPLPPGLPGYNPPGAGSGAADPRAGQDGRDRRDGGQPRNPGGGAQDRQPKQPMSYADELRLQMEQSKARKEAERRAQESPPPPGSPDRSPEAARRQMGSPIPGGDGTGPADQKSRDDAAKKKQLSYQDVLREQVEEKKRKQKEEKEKEKLEEQKEAERIVEEQKKLKQRFQAEQKKQQEKDERIKAENEERRLEAEKKRQFAAQKEKEQDEKFEAQRQQKSPTRDHAASPGHAAAAAASPSAAAAAAAPSPTRFDRAESPPIPTRRKRMTDLEDDPFNLKNKTKWAQAGGPPPVTHEWAEENGSPNARQAPPAVSANPNFGQRSGAARTSCTANFRHTAAITTHPNTSKQCWLSGISGCCCCNIPSTGTSTSSRTQQFDGTYSTQYFTCTFASPSHTCRPTAAAAADDWCTALNNPNAHQHLRSSATWRCSAAGCRCRLSRTSTPNV